MSFTDILGWPDGFSVIGDPAGKTFATRDQAKAHGRLLRLAASKPKTSPAIGAATKSKAPDATSARRFTEADIRAARMQGRLAERARLTEVFASDHSRGRERALSRILCAPQGWTAAQIVGELPNLPTDREYETRAHQPKALSPDEKAAIDATWARAYGSVSPSSPTATDTATAASAADETWTRAYAAIAKGAGR